MEAGDEAVRAAVLGGRDAIALWDALRALPAGEARDAAERWALDAWGVHDADAAQLARRAAWGLGLGRALETFEPGGYELWLLDPRGGHLNANAALGWEDEAQREALDRAICDARAGSMELLLIERFRGFEADAWEIAGASEDEPWSGLRDPRLRMEADLVRGASMMIDMLWRAEQCRLGAALMRALAGGRELIVAWESNSPEHDIGVYIMRRREPRSSGH